jgi:Dyp-type peroxidase family
VTLPPKEPRLALADIQGIAVPGFFKPHHTLIYLRVPKEADLAAYRKQLYHLDVSNGDVTLADRRRARKVAKRAKTTRAALRPREERAVLTAIGFTYAGLLRLAPDAQDISSVAFKHGLARRASLLGDPQDPASPGHPKNWVVGGPHDALDALIVVAGDGRDEVTARAGEIAAAFVKAGAQARVEEGNVRADDPGHEHFGFDDGVSQPGVRGRATDAENDFITERHIDGADVPFTWLYGYPGQDLIWPGELVFGYPATSPDPLIPGPVATGGPAWMANGSFLVYRRLKQDVVAFWKTMRDEAARLATQPGFAGMTDARLAALLVGRWPSGAPVARKPDADDPALGADALANNDFLIDADTPALKIAGERANAYPLAKADPAGVTCPWAAHVRKVNTRDSASDIGGATSTQTKRLLRVGVPFGRSLPAEAKYGDAPDPDAGNRGLLFLSIQSSIEEQFEFLQSRWMNDDARPKTPGGHDMIVGQNGATPDGIRRCTLFGAGLAQAEVRAKVQFVIPTGGAYLFVASISALRTIIAGA